MSTEYVLNDQNFTKLNNQLSRFKYLTKGADHQQIYDEF